MRMIHSAPFRSLHPARPLLSPGEALPTCRLLDPASRAKRRSKPSTPHSLRTNMTSTPAQTPAEMALAELLVSSLNIEGTTAEQIDPEMQLFGGGLGLDSIDALELSLAISKAYGFQLRSDSEENKRIFASLRALSAHIEQHRTT